jgi:FtsZ-interacting cell division protein ZipA
MTELQIGLIGLGATAVVAVLGYNKWQEYRQRKLAERLLEVHHADVLLDDPEPGNADPVSGAAEVESYPDEPSHGAGSRSLAQDERIEPVFTAEPAPEPAPYVPPAAAFAAVEPATRVAAPDRAAVAQPAVAPPALPPLAARPVDETRDSVDSSHLLSPLVDYVASFESVEPAPAGHILGAQSAALAQVRKAVHWIGYNEFAREWEAIVDDGQSEYRYFRVGLQLVDRRGPLADNDLSVFHIAMQDLADQLMAIVDLPARRQVLDGAARLDGFCASVDIQIGINVISQAQAFPGTKLRALAEAAGMVIDADGRFVRCDDEGNVLYVLLNQEPAGFSVDSMRTLVTHGITFLLDVPRVAHGERVFNQMVELARRFADVLRGSLVDDNRRPLSEGALEPIRRQVGEYQAIMAAQSLPAGGPLTRRLFS